MADDVISIYGELLRRNAVPDEHRATVDELVRRGVIGGNQPQKQDGYDPAGVERGGILPIYVDERKGDRSEQVPYSLPLPWNDRKGIALPKMISDPLMAFERSSKTGVMPTAGESLDMAGLGIAGLARRPLAAAPKPRPVPAAVTRQADFDAVGIPSFAPALNDTYAAPANALMGGFFGGSLRNEARRSIGAVERGVDDAIAATGGTRSANEIGGEAQNFLRYNVTGRNPDIDPANLTAFQLQDISGVGPGPRTMREKPVVPRPPVDPWNPQRQVVTDDMVEAAMQTPPRMPTPVPKLMTVEDVILPSQLYREVEDTRAAATAAQQFIDGNAAAKSQFEARLAEIDTARQSLPPHPGPRPPDGHPERAAWDAAFDRFKAVEQQHRALAAERNTITQQYRPFQDAERTIAEAARVKAQADAYRSENLSRVQKAEADRVSQEAQDNYNLRMSNAREEARTRLNQAADAEHMANMTDPARRRAFENQARNRADAEQARRQRESDAAWKTEYDIRSASSIPSRVGGTSRQPYMTEFDAGYEAAKRNTPPIPTDFANPLGNPKDTGLTNTSRLLDSVANDYRMQGLLPGYRRGEPFDADGRVRPDLMRIVQGLAGSEVAVRLAALSERRPAGVGQLGIEGLDMIRTAIGRALEDARKPIVGGQVQGEGATQRGNAAFLARLYDAFSKDVDAAVARTDGGQLASAQRGVLRESYKAFFDEIRKPLAKVISDKTTPEQALALLQKAARGGTDGDARMLRAYFRVAREKGDDLRATGALLTEMSKDGLPGFLTAWRSMPDDVKRLMANGGGDVIVRRLDELARVGGYLERFAGTARPASSVADYARRTASGQNVMTALIAMWNAPMAIAGAVGQVGAARVMASPAFKKWLLRVSLAKQPKQLNQAVLQAMRVAAQNMGQPQAAKPMADMVMEGI